MIARSACIIHEAARLITLSTETPGRRRVSGNHGQRRTRGAVLEGAVGCRRLLILAPIEAGQQRLTDCSTVLNSRRAYVWLTELRGISRALLILASALIGSVVTPQR